MPIPLGPIAQAASREEIRRTLDALELVPWVGGGGGAGHGAQGDAAAFQRAVAEARAAFRCVFNANH